MVIEVYIYTWYGHYVMTVMNMYGMVWHGIAWYGMVWHGMVWHGMEWYCMAWYGMQNNDMLQGI